MPKPSRIWRKSVVSLMYDAMFLTLGCKKKSINLDMRSVGHQLPDTIGLPGGFSLSLCILGSM